jgi:hypothetical protein
MADAVVAPRKKKNPRVERRGRFTITEIEPDSPASSTMGEAPTYRTHAEMQDGHISEEDEDADGPHHESGEDGDVEGDDDDDHGGGGQRHSLVRESALEAAAVLFSTSTSERISPFGSAVFEHSTSSTERVVDMSGDGVSLNIETAVNNERLDEGDGDGVERRIRSATIDATERRIRSPTFDETSSQDNRRVKQKGRFTIIELSSDSPRSRKNSAEVRSRVDSLLMGPCSLLTFPFFLQEFSNTTSISVTSTQVSQANQASTQSLGTSPSTSGVSYGHIDTNGTTASAVFARMVSETNTAPTRTSRSLVVEASRRGRENDSRRANLGGRRSTGRLHSVSPLRERTYSDRFSHQELGSSYGGTGSTTSVRGQSFDPLLVNTSPQFRPAPSPSNGMSSMSLSSSYSSSMAGTTPTGHSSSRQSGPELGANKRHLASRQKAITISAEQFIQQQHTIASLIRQQQELKQLIGVLAEQQQHLVAMPKELADFRLDQAQRFVWPGCDGLNPRD